MSFLTLPLRKSSVSVEELVSTSEDRVDMLADRTRITTMAIRIVGRPSSIVGMMLSKPPAGVPEALGSSTLLNNRPKPPRK